MPVTEERVALITRPFRYVSTDIPGTREVFPTAAAEEVPGYFPTAADAQTVNAPVALLKSDPRAGLYKLPFDGVIDIDFDGTVPRISGAVAEGLDPDRHYLVLAASCDGKTTELIVRG